MMQWFRRFMAGRYGTDSLHRFMSVISWILLLVSLFTGGLALYLLAMLSLLCTLFRSFSRDTWKRSRENQQYLQAKGKLAAAFLKIKTQFRQRKTHRFYKCQSCRTTLRIPKGRGRVIITCPKCRMSFESIS